ncbi:TetR/AcrR family transcriptional regulator [Rhodococcus sp. Z13]|uniref:TetR/AcrR family transcriptional regulator n=1 Tax=Rhodococcus sacchari TaxID=2962047 RepID=A0ACD4DK89_9NOCA|nr:TetR/AcrR family transcriptional regulator [Rhodococcus sp. Z13]UYP20401.1 TetR/AcrR family transcriptional regulator [Rhodococcus sp. Z13]
MTDGKARGGPRAAMTASAIALMRQRGVAATSFRDVLEHSGAPRGSIYHHFPGGKAQLVEEATEAAARRIERALAERIAGTGVAGTVRAVVGLWSGELEATGYVAGCPVVAAGLGNEDAARARAGAAFERFVEVIAQALAADGVPERRARSLGTLVIGALEGALVMAQAQRSPAPLDAVIEELEDLLGSLGA